MDIIKWDVYEMFSKSESLLGVRCRRRIRNYAIRNGFNVLTDNALDKENVVRFAVLENYDISELEKYLHSQFEDLEINKIVSGIENPTLSKWKINDGRD
jgi:hypothetical protein